MKIIVTGASGGLGSFIMKKFKEHELVGLCLNNKKTNLLSLDLTSWKNTKDYFFRFKPDIIIHCVSWIDVDACEKYFNKTFQTNVITTYHIRKIAENISAKVIYISTNDIFDGKTGMYDEDNLPNPINNYSRTKYMGEQLLYDYVNHLIIRFTYLSWNTSGKQTFPSWIYNSLLKGKPVGLFVDQFNSPLYGGTVAEYIEKLVLADAKGIYHFASDRLSRYECGLMIAKKMNLDLNLIEKKTLKSQNFTAARPVDVSLCSDKLRIDYGLETTIDSEIHSLVSEIKL